jgi:hypothetical protein
MCACHVIPDCRKLGGADADTYGGKMFIPKFVKIEQFVKMLKGSIYRDGIK